MSPSDFLATLEPRGIYDHRIAHKLRDAGVIYDENLRLLAHGGLFASLETHTPAELVQSVDWLNDRAERMVRAADLARAVHELLLPMQPPPSKGMVDEAEGFDADLASIEQGVASGAV